MMRGAALVAALAVVVAGCGSSDDSAGDDGGTKGDVAAAAGLDDSGTAINDSCGVLSDDQVTAAIGAHKKPEQDYVFGGCYWQSTEGPSDVATAWGLRVAVNLTDDMVAALDPELGQPVDGLGPDATYDDTSHELWFDCADQRRCVVDAVLESSSQSRDTAVEVAKLVQAAL